MSTLLEESVDFGLCVLKAPRAFRTQERNPDDVEGEEIAGPLIASKDSGDDPTVMALAGDLHAFHGSLSTIENISVNGSPAQIRSLTVSHASREVQKSSPDGAPDPFAHHVLGACCRESVSSPKGLFARTLLVARSVVRASGLASVRHLGVIGIGADAIVRDSRRSRGWPAVAGQCGCVSVSAAV